MDTENLRCFLYTNKHLLSLNGIEKHLELGKGTVSKFVHGHRSMPEHHLEKIEELCKRLSYKPEMHYDIII